MPCGTYVPDHVMWHTCAVALCLGVAGQRFWTLVKTGAHYTSRFDRMSELVHALHQQLLNTDTPIRVVPRVPTSCMVHVYLYVQKTSNFVQHAVALSP
jgi:hypothetical protein